MEISAGTVERAALHTPPVFLPKASGSLKVPPKTTGLTGHGRGRESVFSFGWTMIDDPATGDDSCVRPVGRGLRITIQERDLVPKLEELCVYQADGPEWGLYVKKFPAKRSRWTWLELRNTRPIAAASHLRPQAQGPPLF